MKKILTFAFLVVFMKLSMAQCTIDTSLIPPGKFAYPDTLPCVERTMAYSQVVQFKIPSTINLQDFGFPLPFYLTIDSIVVTGVTGLPTNMSAIYNPSSGVFYGGNPGCFNVSGTTSDPVGNYPVTLQGTVTAHGMPFPPYFDGDTTLDLSVLNMLGGGGPFNLSLDVIEPGTQCRSTSNGIAAIAAFNAQIKAYPNPAETNLFLDINSAERMLASITIYNVLGEKMFTENIDLLGSASKQINVNHWAEGIYTLVIADQKHQFKKQFLIK